MRSLPSYVWMMPRSDKSFTVRLGGHVREIWDSEGCRIEHEAAVAYGLTILYEE